MPYTEITKNEANYHSGISDWFHNGWFDGWFYGKALSSFAQITKNESNYTEITKL